MTSDLTLVVLAFVVGAAWVVGIVNFVRVMSRIGKRK